MIILAVLLCAAASELAPKPRRRFISCYRKVAAQLGAVNGRRRSLHEIDEGTDPGIIQDIVGDAGWGIR